MLLSAYDWFILNYIISFHFIFVDANRQNTLISGQMCSKIKSILSFGKYQTYQISSNVTYVTRSYAQNFLAYSSFDDILLLIEPKYNIHVYNATTVHSLVSLTTENITYATSSMSLTNFDRSNLFFLYETRLSNNSLSLTICEMNFNRSKFDFKDKICIQSLIIHSDRPDIRINGFDMKHNHAAKNKSILFISTDIGLIYAVFDKMSRLLIREATFVNETSVDGNVVITSSGLIFYSNKHENALYELYVTRDFRVQHSKILKSNAIRAAFGLIADECNHLYIATRSMILVMLVEGYRTIRSISTKASDLPITIVRMNSTTYVYTTVRRLAAKDSGVWMLNFVSFSETEKSTFITSRHDITIAMTSKSPIEATQTTDSPITSHARQESTIQTTYLFEKLDSIQTHADQTTVLPTTQRSPERFTSMFELLPTQLSTIRTSQTELQTFEFTTRSSRSSFQQSEKTSESILSTQFLHTTQQQKQTYPIYKSTTILSKNPEITTKSNILKLYDTSVNSLLDILSNKSSIKPNYHVDSNISFNISPDQYSLNSNLTMENIKANHLSTNILNLPIHLHFDKIQVKQFSLNIKSNRNQTHQSLSNVDIGRIQSQIFQMNVTQTNNININAQHIDAETAEIIFDEHICHNNGKLQVNLNLTKSGKIQYGNRTSINIGPVFARLHMHKQSCDSNQPFSLFFDICQGQNPCLNDGTCEILMPDYDSPFYSQQDSSEINYKCICPLYTSGEHCQYAERSKRICLNGGNLTEFINIHNQTSEICSCLTGFQGEHCEKNNNDCVHINCSNHGTCRDEINSYKCVCFDGYFGDNCEQTTVETMVLEVASKSFASVAILLIIGIVILFIASDIHTYLTKRKRNYELNLLSYVSSELFENAKILLGFRSAPLELNDFSAKYRIKPRSIQKSNVKYRNKRMTYKQFALKKYTKTLEKSSRKHQLLIHSSFETNL